MNSKSAFFLAGVLVLGAALASPQASAFGHFRARASGAKGTGFVAGGRGANGGAYLRGRAVTRDGQGNAGVVSGGAYRGPNGGTAARAGQTTRNADGSIDHQSGFRAQAANGGSATRSGQTSRDAAGNLTHQANFSAQGPDGGNVQSSGGYTRTAAGVNQSRTTTATGTKGNTYTGTTSYNPQTGLTHTGTCTDANGNTIPCH